MEKIRNLEVSDLFSQEQIKEFYFRLSVIFREYLEGRYQISALDRTTSELLSEFRRLNFTLDMNNQVRDLLDNADLVKFAKVTPEPEEIEGDLNRVKNFVAMTTPVKEEAVEKTEETIPV